MTPTKALPPAVPADAAPPSIRNAGKMTSPPFGDQPAMLMMDGWFLVAIASLVLVAMGRWRWGAAAYVLAGAVGLVAYHWEYWTYAGSEMVTRAQATDLSIHLLPMHLAVWLQLGLAALVAGGLIRLIVVRVRRLRQPA